MIRLRLEALALAAASRLGRHGPNLELGRLAKELADLAREGSPGPTGGPGQADSQSDR